MNENTIVFDLETTGLDPTAHDAKIHVMCVNFLNADLPAKFYDPLQMVEVLNSYDYIIGHNIINFDIPYLEQISGKKITASPFDTAVVARALFPAISTIPSTRHPHSLESWGIRLGELKGDFAKATDWKNCTPEMIEYCHQDVKVTKKLYQYLQSEMQKDQKIYLMCYDELRVAEIIQRQQKNGIGFNKRKAIEFLTELKQKEQLLLKTLQDLFRPEYEATGIIQETINHGLYTKIILKEFNPDSNQQIIKRFKEKYNWIPTVFTAPTSRYPDGQPVCNEEVLAGLAYPEAKIIIEISQIRKLIGFISEGKESWLKLEKNGIIHGQVQTTGVVTGRMSHKKPNLAQVPSSNSELGRRCRELFIPTKQDLAFVGCDAAGLENRCLAHYLASYDNGDYAKKVGTVDIHALNAIPLETTRAKAKTALYGLIYGCGIAKFATILEVPQNKAKKLKQALFDSIPGIERLTNEVKLAAKRGYLIAIDGRKLPIPKDSQGYQTHKALNYLLQSAGAILMKHALLLASLEADSWKISLAFVANIHDEFIVECPLKETHEIGKLLVRAIKRAGEVFNLKCPLDAEYKVGYNWSEIH